MVHITTAEANAWLESTKLELSAIEAALDEHIATIVKSKLSAVFDTSAWVDENTTPTLVRTIISMHYVAAIYDRSYGDDIDESTSNYARILRRMADVNIEGLISGSIILEEDPEANSGAGTPVFFPNDLSSANAPTDANPSDGGPAFLMGTVF